MNTFLTNERKIMKVNLKRIYEEYENVDGFRILVDRLWPRGIKKEKAQIDSWMKEVAPSTALRKWFGHDPDKWPDFVSKYKKELQGSMAFRELVSLVKKHKTVTLLFSARDEAHNQAVALKEFLKAKLP
jgi:uncharacterized protein YeaO (DUF488 family)